MDLDLAEEITLLTSDKQEIKVDLNIACKSKFLKGMVEEDNINDAIMLENISMAILKVVL